MYRVISVVLVFVITGCSTGTSDTFISSNTDILFVDQNGESLTNPNHPNAITEENTEIYFLEDGSKKKIFKGHLDCPKMFCIEQGPKGKYYFSLHPNTESSNGKRVTYIKFADATWDTVRVQLDSPGSSNKAVTKVWYNQKLRWDASNANPGNRGFTVTRKVKE
ncbi:MAG: hypothetical protein U5J63_03645 [Fodinibius sp.]|nr:hypothetical protein [Fodinibius sp.]